MLQYVTMRFPILRRGNDESPIAWWEWLFAPLLYPATMLLFLLAGILAIPFAIVMVIFQWFRDRRFARKMRELGRFISWEELEPRLQSGDGTLVIEQAQKAGVRVWWTGADIAQQAPVQPPPEEELDYLRFGTPHPFVTWCFSRYLDSVSGQALLTEPPFSYPPGFVDAAFFIEKYPKARVVMSVKVA
jgi:hypothetical protein